MATIHSDDPSAKSQGFGIVTLASLYPVMFVEILGFVSSPFPSPPLPLLSPLPPFPPSPSVPLSHTEISLAYSDASIIKSHGAGGKEDITEGTKRGGEKKRKRSGREME